MAVKYGKKKPMRNNVFYTVVTAILLCAVFLAMVVYFYSTAEDEAYENLHVQTKQIKDDITLQLISDRENLQTMANFAAKLYSDGESYNLMFDSFKPIGLIENIGILTPDNNFVTKAGSINFDGLISFSEEKARGAYISGRVKDLTRDNYEIIRTAVPIVVEEKTVGILYGVIKLDKIGERYNKMAKELDAQLFVYDKEHGELVIDTVHRELGNISFLKDRKYNKGYSYEGMINSEKGFVSFMSAYKNENLHMHYSTIEDIGWMIALGRYDSQVFNETHKLIRTLLFVFFIMLVIIGLYVIILMAKERHMNSVTACASDVRKELLETTAGQDNITDALKEICTFAVARSAIFFDTEGESYYYISPEYGELLLSEKERIYFRSQLFHYAAEYHEISGRTVNILCVKPNKHMLKTNPSFYKFLKGKNLREISFSATIKRNNYTVILAVINPKYGDRVRMLAEKISACFSMALYNKNHLDKTELTARTDALTGALNRVSYNEDVVVFDTEKPFDFSCIFIDVNELHLCNNKYGHAAGDKMLIYIANTLKEIFYGQKIYRMGGDEFLIFCQNSTLKEIEKNIKFLDEQLELHNYHVSSGVSYRTQNTNTHEMVAEAEKRMYEAKAQYYQNKEMKNHSAVGGEDYIQLQTGIAEIDTLLSVLKENYNGIYRVSLNSNTAKRILMPAYLGYNEDEEYYSDLFTKYVEASVKSDYHRSVLSFINYEVIKKQLMENKTPRIKYKKNNGEIVVLSVYKLGSSNTDTLWVFARE